MTATKRKPIRSFRDLEVYQMSYGLAMDVFRATQRFPPEEVYSLTRQIRNASRSVPANIAEGWSKRHYENVFKRHSMDAMGSTDETEVWLNMALDCGYLNEEDYGNYGERCESVGKMLQRLTENWRTFR